MYMKDGLEEAVVIGGLEPFLQFEELNSFITLLRKSTSDDVVIYTGYYRNEIEDKIGTLAMQGNIIVKYGRYIPNRPHVKDDILGVTLASDNQYAERVG